MIAEECSDGEWVALLAWPAVRSDDGYRPWRITIGAIAQMACDGDFALKTALLDKPAMAPAARAFASGTAEGGSATALRRMIGPT